MPRKAIVESLCPYYYRKCTLKTCNHRPSTESVLAGFDVWMKEVDKLKNCPCAGAELSKKDYASRQERVVVENKKGKK
jgi:hypothetical protein